MKSEVKTSCVPEIRLDCAIIPANKTGTNREIESLQRLRALAGARACRKAKAAHEALIASQSHSKVTEVLPALHTSEVARALAAHEASHPPTHLPVGGCSTPTIWPKRPNHRKNSNQ